MVNGGDWTQSTRIWDVRSYTVSYLASDLASFSYYWLSYPVLSSTLSPRLAAHIFVLFSTISLSLNHTLNVVCGMCRGAALAPAPATTVPPSASGPGSGAALRQPRLRSDRASPGGGCTRWHSRVRQVPQVSARARPSPGCLSTPARLQPQLPAAGMSSLIPSKYTILEGIP